MIAELWRRLIRLSFRLLYDEFAFGYDGVSRLVSLDRWRCWQRSVLPYLGPDKTSPVLELAHGTGNLQLDLLASGHRSVALDLSPTMGRIAKRKLAKQGFCTDFVRGDALKTPFKPDSFPVIVCTFPTTFIIQETTLSEMHRILKVDGHAIIVLSGYLTGGGLIPAVIKFLYRLTGQAYDASEALSISGHFSDAGFNVDCEEVKLADSVVTLLVLKKLQLKCGQGSDSHLVLPLCSC